jgi:hypothetical protein
LLGGGTVKAPFIHRHVRDGTREIGEDLGLGTKHWSGLGSVDPDVFSLNGHDVFLFLMGISPVVYIQDVITPFLFLFPSVNAV